MDETISVVFTPIQGFPGQYHGTLVYTNSSGQQFYAGATRSTWSTPATIPGALQAEIAEITGIGSDPLGTLITVGGSLTSSLNDSGPTQNWFSPGNPSYTLFSGQNLSSQWSTVTSTMNQIGNLGLPYAPLDQNSNSAWCTAAINAGASSQTLFAAQVASGANAPGCGTFISTPSNPTNSADPFSNLLTIGTNSQGNTTYTDSQIYNGAVDQSTVVTTNASLTGTTVAVAASTGNGTLDVVGAGGSSATLTDSNITNVVVTAAYMTLWQKIVYDVTNFAQTVGSTIEDLVDSIIPSANAAELSGTTIAVTAPSTGTAPGSTSSAVFGNTGYFTSDSSQPNSFNAQGYQTGAPSISLVDVLGLPLFQANGSLDFAGVNGSKSSLAFGTGGSLTLANGSTSYTINGVTGPVAYDGSTHELVAIGDITFSSGNVVFSGSDNLIVCKRRSDPTFRSFRAYENLPSALREVA
jgi:hypothetical protein